MTTIRRNLLFAISAFLCAVLCATLFKPAALAGWRQESNSCPALASAHMRTTLYFGLAHSRGSVTEEEWQIFVREEVTPRFPDGLTFWTASGQWRRPNGSIAEEQAKVLLLVHDATSAGRAAVRTIAERYKTIFKQESVLSETAVVCAEF